MVLEELARAEGFRRGVVAGGIALLVVAVLALALRRPPRAPLLGLAGVAVAVSTLVALAGVESPASTDGLLVALVVLAAGLVVASSQRWPLAVWMIAATPGAAMVASTDAVRDIDIGWVRPLTFL